MALYSHVSAAQIWGLYVWNGSPDVHVTARSALAGDSAVPGVRVHRRTLAPDQRRRITRKRYGVVRVTSLEQTIVDCARTEPFITAVIIGDSGLHRGASLERMNQLVAGMVGHRGVRAARRVLAALDKGSQSAGETRLRLEVASMKIPQPEYQVWLRAAGNNYRVDGAWREIKLALEFDGKSKYFDYKRTDEAIYEERQRERELMEVGWRFIRVEWKSLADPDLLKRRIRSAIDAASRRFKP
ncbi:type IV toxin-antitoxin system AbiEi family antitoxin domain-containing protein [Arthrobacter psychrolactophilus]